MKLILLLLGFLSLVTVGCNERSEREIKMVEIDSNIVFANQLHQKKSWAVVDYEKGVDYLVIIKQRDLKYFSGYLKERGRDIFNRLTDHRHYDSLWVDKHIDEQLRIIIRLTNAVNRLARTCYETPTIKGKLVAGKEIIRSQVASLAVNGKSIDLVNIKFPDKEAVDDVRKQGWKKAQSGTFLMILGALKTLRDDHRLYEKEDIIRLAIFLPGHIKQVENFIKPQDRETIITEVKKLREGTSFPEIKEAFADY